MRIFRALFILLFTSLASAQETPAPVSNYPNPFKAVDSLYREDQFYFSVTYNRMQNTPSGYTQNGLSTGFHAGFIRDMPFNKKRTAAIGLGLGLSWNKYHHDLFVNPDAYSILDEVNYSRNKMEQVFVEVPLELRWRNSTPESTKFWRIYAGFKVKYLIYDKSKFIGDQDVVVTNNKDFDKLQYGPTLSVGYNTWNFHAYYGLNSIFKSGEVNGEKLQMKTLNLGLMFYIL